MKAELIERLLEKSYSNPPDGHLRYGLTESDMERLIANVVEHCIVVIEKEMDVMLETNQPEAFSMLVDVSFKMMDEFGIDKIDDADQKLLDDIDKWIEGRNNDE